LFILSRIRNLEDETFKLLEAMPFHYNIEQDYLYRKGIDLGMNQKEYEKNVFFVKSLLSNTNFAKEKIAQLANVSLDFVKSIAENLPQK
jgi:hypothetical protein